MKAIHVIIWLNLYSRDFQANTANKDGINNFSHIKVIGYCKSHLEIGFNSYQPRSVK